VLWTGIGGYYALTERWREFVDATFLFNVSYAESTTPFIQRFLQFFSPPRHPFVFDSALPLWIGGIVAGGALLVLLIARKRRDISAALLYLGASYLAVCLPGHFWPHYYYLMIPPLVIVLTLALELAAATLVRHRTAPSRSGNAWPPLLVGSVFVGLLGWSEIVHYRSQPPFGITITRYNSRDFWGRAMGEKLGSVTDPGDSVFVYGNEAEIYYYAKRRCASRFTMISGIAAGRSGVEERRRILIDELRRNRPRVILLLFDEQPFAEWKAFLDEHYGQPVGWDLHDRTGEPIMYVLADTGRPIPSIDWNWDRKEVGGWFLEQR
jgi:hypothetical protein